MLRRQFLHCPIIDSDEKNLSQTIVLLELKFMSLQLSIYFQRMNCLGIEHREIISYWYLNTLFISLFTFLFIINIIVYYYYWKEISGNLGEKRKKEGEREKRREGRWGWAWRRTWLRVSAHGTGSTWGCLLAFYTRNFG